MFSRVVAGGYACIASEPGTGCLALELTPAKPVPCCRPYQRALSGADQLGLVSLTATTDLVDPGPDLTRPRGPDLRYLFVPEVG